MDDTSLAITLSIVCLVAGGLGNTIKDFLYTAFGFAKKTDKVNASQETEIALLNQRMNTFESNHLVHQKAIEDALIKNNDEHREGFIALARIEGKIDNLK